MSAGNGWRFNYYPHHWHINSPIKVPQSVGEEGAAEGTEVTVTAAAVLLLPRIIKAWRMVKLAARIV